MRRYIGGGTAVSRGRKVIGALGLAQAGPVLPSLILQSPMLLSFDTDHVVIAAPSWVGGVDSITYTALVNDAPVTIAVPALTFVAAAGDTVQVTAVASKAGYGAANTTADLVIPPIAGFMLGNADWVAAEATLDADTRRAAVGIISIAPPAGKVWGVSRTNTATGNIAFLGIMTDNGPGAVPYRYTWLSGGRAANNDMQYISIAACNADGTGGVWQSGQKSYRASTVPAAPVAQVLTGTTLGTVRITIPDQPVNGGRALTAYNYRIGTVVTALPDGVVGTTQTVTIAGVDPIDIDFQAVNANGGSAFSTPKQTVTPGVNIISAPIQTVTSITFAGGLATWTFDAPTDVQLFHTGELHIISNRAVNIISQTPTSGDIAGTIGNGIMENTYAVTLTSPQGYDQLMDTGRPEPSVYLPFLASLNKHTAIAGPYPITVGKAVTLSQTIRLAVPLFYQKIERIIYVTISPDPIRSGDFRPPVSAIDKTPIVNFADIDLSRLLKLPTPAGLATQAQAVDGNRPEAIMGWSGEGLQVLNMQAAGPSGSNYAGIYSAWRIDAHHRMNTDIPDAEKLELFLPCLTRAIDRVGIWLRGSTGSDGAGQHAAIHTDLLKAYVVTRKQIFLDCFMAMRASSVTRGFLVQEQHLDAGQSAYPHGSSIDYRYQEPYMPEDLGRSMRVTDNGMDSQPIARYRITCRPSSVSEAIDLWSQTMPDGTKAWQMMEADPQRRFLDYMNLVEDLVRQEPDNYGQTGMTARHRAAWDLWRPLLAKPVPQVTPQMIDVTWLGGSPFNGNNTIRMSAGVGTISFDYAAFSAPQSYSVLDKTGIDYYVSLDAVQKVIIDGGLNYNPTFANVAPGVPVMPGMLHHGGLRFKNAAGAGKFSPMHPVTAAPSGGFLTRNPRMAVTPGGAAPAVAPGFAIAPVIHYNRSPNWKGKDWQPLIGEVPNTVIDLTVGNGYPSGGMPTLYEYQWQRNTATPEAPVWEDIIGAIAKTYSRVIADFGRQLRAGVRASNASGTSPYVYSQPVSVPLAPVFPATTVFRSNFGADFPLIWPNVRSTAVATGGVVEHAPYQTFVPVVADGAPPPAVITTTGAFLNRKNGSNPRINFNLAADRPLTIGGTYRLTFDAPVNWIDSTVAGTSAWGGNGFYEINRTAGIGAGGNIVVARQTIARPAVVTDPLIYRFTHDIVIPAGYPVGAMWLLIQLSVASGGTAGGIPSCADAWLERIA